MAKKKNLSNEPLEADISPDDAAETEAAPEQETAALEESSPEAMIEPEAEEVSEDLSKSEAFSEPLEVVTAPVEPSLPAISLHAHLERMVRTLRDPEAVHLLNKLEILLGTLKLDLPAAIAAVSDEHLKAHLEDLQALL